MAPFHIRRRAQSAAAGRAGARRLAVLAALAAPLAVAGDPAAIARGVVAEQLGIPVAGTRVWSVTPRNFGDGSLDCPEPGMAYAQVITPGHAVVVEAEGRRFDVRVAGDGGRICYPRKAASRRAPPPGSPAGTVTGPAALARADLAGLLGLPPDAVTVLESHARGPREGLPGCGPAPATAGEQVITLTADGRTWQYVAADGRVRPCPPAATR